MNRNGRILFSLTTVAFIFLYGRSLEPSLTAWSLLLALALLYLAIVWIPEPRWTPASHGLTAGAVIVLVLILHQSSHSPTVPESLLLIPLVLLLAREAEGHQGFFVVLAVITLAAMWILAPVPAFIWIVIPVVIALYMSVRAINIYKAAYRLSLQNIDELNAAHAELQKTHAALQAATVDSMRYTALAERTRLAQEIHDGLGHQLTALIVQLQALEIMLPKDPVRSAGLVPGMLQAAREAMAEVHWAVRTWREEEGSDGLVALQGLVSQTAAHAPFIISFTACTDFSSWPERLSTALYRILQEALTNILRHASATTVAVQVSERSGQVLLVVSDDGCYTERTDLVPGYGLQGIMERCQALGGTCHLSANQPHGLVLQISLPIRDAPETPEIDLPGGRHEQDE